MSVSNTTKQAMADAFKELLAEQTFEKISVSDICDGCHMNRKSFYYHFRDKFDLVNWIFDTEFCELNQAYALDIGTLSLNFDDYWKNVEVICQYFYDNRSFYRRILKVDGENSFSAHFREFIRPLFQVQVEDLLGLEDVPQMVYDFLMDGLICAIERWLMDKNCITTEEFVNNLKKLIQILVAGLRRMITTDPKWLE